MSNQTNQRQQTREISGNIYNNCLLQYLNEFQKMLAPSYGLNATTLGQLQYDTETAVTPKVTTTNDGYAILEGANYAQTNPIKESIRIILLNTARRVNLLVGDGTSTAMLLLIGLAKDIIENKMSVGYKITEDDLIKFETYMKQFIKDNTQGVKQPYRADDKYYYNTIFGKKIKPNLNTVSKRDLYNYALIATRSKGLAKDISELVNKLPIGVRPSIEKDSLNMDNKTTFDVQEDSFYLSSTIGSHDFLDINKYTRTMSNVYIASTLQTLSYTGVSQHPFIGIYKTAVQMYIDKPQDYNFLLICPGLEDNLKITCLDFDKYIKSQLSLKGIECKHTLSLVPIIIGRGGKETNHDFNKAIYEDFIGLMSSRAFNNHKNESITDLTIADLGFAKKVEIGLRKTIFTNPKSNIDIIETQQKKLHRILSQTDDISSNEMLKEFLARKSRLALCYASVNVGGATDAEQHNTFKLLEDGIYGACTVKETGFIPGGNVLLSAGLQSYNSIQKATGYRTLELDGMHTPIYLLCKTSNNPKFNAGLIAELLKSGTTKKTFSGDIKEQSEDFYKTQEITRDDILVDYTSVLQGYTIDFKNNGIVLAHKSGIIDSSQMLLEVITSVFSSLKEILKNSSFRIIEEAEFVQYYPKNVEVAKPLVVVKINDCKFEDSGLSLSSENSNIALGMKNTDFETGLKDKVILDEINNVIEMNNNRIKQAKKEWEDFTYFIISSFIVFVILTIGLSVIF